MPLSLDPQATTRFPLESDKPKPDDARPEFEARFVTVSQRMRIRKLLDEAEAQETDEQSLAKLTEAIGITLVAWHNMGVPFDLAKLPDLLTAAEMWELAHGLLAHTRIAEHEKRFFASRPTSDAAPSAPDAGPPASAQRNSPSPSNAPPATDAVAPSAATG